MARSRNIKPGFFTNDGLAELPALTRLLFIGLWTLVDRDGRIEDRPKKIKAEVLPYDDCDADAMLSSLHVAGFIERYTVGEVRCIRVVNWEKHQNPHVKEQASSLPAPVKHQTCTVQIPDLPSASAEQALKEVNPCPEHARLIPSLLIPDFLSLDSLKETSSPASLPTPACPVRDLIKLFVEAVPDLPKPRPELWAKSKAADAMRERWKWVLTESKDSGERYAETKEEAMKWFGKFFARVAESDFLMGRNGKWTACDLGWLMQRENFRKVVEGNYMERQPA